MSDEVTGSDQALFRWLGQLIWAAIVGTALFGGEPDLVDALATWLSR